jgi:hypothetical protein
MLAGAFTTCEPMWHSPKFLEFFALAESLLRLNRGERRGICWEPRYLESANRTRFVRLSIKSALRRYMLHSVPPVAFSMDRSHDIH